VRLSIGTDFTCRITNMREETAPLRIVQALCEPANNILLDCGQRTHLVPLRFDRQA
jgi:hypothetical protein